MTQHEQSDQAMVYVGGLYIKVDIHSLERLRRWLTYHMRIFSQKTVSG